MAKISVIINTLNEEKNFPRAISSIKGFADEIVVVDMKSTDNTVAIAKKEGARVYQYRRVGYVEPARNFAISKATGDWIFVLDADEVLPLTLAKKLKKITQNPHADYYRVPRKNIIFGKWIRYSRWWPDFNIRFFKKGKVSWNEVIHSVPMTVGTGADLGAREDSAIIHYNYNSIEQYLERMNRYTTIQSKELISRNYKFIWKDLIVRPMGEFLGRYFASEGYKDGVHGLALAILQAFSEAVLYLKLWQEEKFLEQGITLPEISRELGKAQEEMDWWLKEILIKSGSFLASLPHRILRRLKRKDAK